MTSKEWPAQTFSFNWLRKQSADHAYLKSAEAFLKAVGVVPKHIVLTRGNKNPVVGLKPEAIKARYLAEVAYDWDRMGQSSPVEFIDMLSFEVFGTPQREAMDELYTALFVANDTAEEAEEENFVAA